MASSSPGSNPFQRMVASRSSMSRRSCLGLVTLPYALISPRSYTRQPIHDTRGRLMMVSTMMRLSFLMLRTKRRLPASSLGNTVLSESRCMTMRSAPPASKLAKIFAGISTTTACGNAVATAARW